MNSMIRVENTKDHGRVVVATSDLDPGTSGLEVLAEEALLVVPPFESVKATLPPIPRELVGLMDTKFWVTYWYYKKQSEVVKEKLRGFYAELDCSVANALRRLLTPIAERENINVEEFILVAMVFHADGGEGPGINYGSGLFEIACRMSHSCKPNSCWISSQDGKKKLVRLLLPVKKGQELTISYSDVLMAPAHVRRSTLLESKNFLCNCPRCNQSHDDTRRFFCTSKHCTGVFFVQQVKDNEQPTFTDCTECGKSVTKTLAASFLEQERRLKQEIDYVEYVTDNGILVDVTERIKKLRPPHPFHHLAEPCFKIQGELYTQLGQFRTAAFVNQAWVDCRDGILGEDYRDRGTAFACERVGDSLVECNDLKAAERAPQRTVCILQVTDGLDQPYTMAALNKLFVVQRRMTTVGEEKCCALCGVVSTLKCARCGQLVLLVALDIMLRLELRTPDL